MIEATRLEDTGKRREQPMDEDEKKMEFALAISEHEMYELCQSHVQMMLALTSCAWKSQKTTTNVDVDSWDILRPMLMMYQMTSDIVKASWEVLGEYVASMTGWSHYSDLCPHNFFYCTASNDLINCLMYFK